MNMIGVMRRKNGDYWVIGCRLALERTPAVSVSRTGKSLWMQTPKSYSLLETVNPREVLAEYQRYRHRERFTARVRKAEEEYIRLKSMTSKWLAAQQLRFLREHAAAKKEFDRCVKAK